MNLRYRFLPRLLFFFFNSSLAPPYNLCTLVTSLIQHVKMYNTWMARGTHGHDRVKFERVLMVPYYITFTRRNMSSSSVSTMK